MWKRHRTKPALSLLIIACGSLAYFAYDGPASDRRFLLWCLLGFGLFLFTLLVVARIVRCPRCGADMGYFAPFPGSLNWRRMRPRYVDCKYCGCTVDRQDGNRAV